MRLLILNMKFFINSVTYEDIKKRRLYESFSKCYGDIIEYSSKRVKKYLDDDIEFVGVFDKELGNPLYDLSSLAIMGFVDALKN